MPIRAAALLTALVLLSPAPAPAGTFGEVQDLAGLGARFPDAAYNPTDRRWLVVWVDYSASGVWGRVLTDDGLPSGSAFQLASGPVSLFPSVVFNAKRGEWLVAFQDEGHGNPVFVQRVRGSDGAFVSGNVPIAATASGGHADVAWSQTSDVYLVVFVTPADFDIHARLLSGDGQPLGGDIAVRVDAEYSGYPSVAWGDARDEFLATWDWDRDNFANIWGQRVDATGALQGGPIEITSGGKQGRSTAAWDPLRQRWLVQFNDASVAGNSFDQGGQFVNADGTLGPAVPIADTPQFEGDTILGAPIAFAAGVDRYLSSFVVNSGLAVQELDASGAKVGTQVVLAPGDFGCLGSAAASSGRRVLTVWEELSGAKHVYSRLYEVGPDCQPACAGKACGDDGCGGSCGTCRPDERCTGGACEPAVERADASAVPETDAGTAPPLDASVPAAHADASHRPSETEARGSCGCSSTAALFPLLLLALARPTRARAADAPRRKC